MLPYPTRFGASKCYQTQPVHLAQNFYPDAHQVLLGPVTRTNYINRLAPRKIGVFYRYIYRYIVRRTG